MCSHWWMRDKEGARDAGTVTWTFTEHPTEQTAASHMGVSTAVDKQAWRIKM